LSPLGGIWACVSPESEISQRITINKFLKSCRSTENISTMCICTSVRVGSPSKGGMFSSFSYSSYNTSFAIKWSHVANACIWSPASACKVPDDSEPLLQPYVPALTKYNRNPEQNSSASSLDAPSINESDYFASHYRFLNICFFQKSNYLARTLPTLYVPQLSVHSMEM
jgi:hypothetical protein